MRTEVEELFLAAADLPGAERDPFLEARCADPSILAEVRSLLAHDQAGDTHLRDSLHAVAASAAALRSFGPYRATRLLGAGGMGAVYLAERTDGEIRQRVAIKVPQISVSPALFLARFRRERQILSQLTHPYIARLLDAGTTEDGVPYLVMEYIEGQPLDSWSVAQDQNLAAHIGLFLKICEGVEYAHQHLIVHRDLKPGNILVTADGTPKLLDFGVAKVLGDADPHATSTQVLTPAYASPEQVRGEAVTTATDVYALGGVLYRLLTGRPPHQVEGKTPAEIQTAICDREPQKPSALRPELKGDLENILLMALRKEPGRRYRTVPQLAADLGRWRTNLPVSASPDTLAYRGTRFWKRNRLAVTAAVTVSAALIIGAGLAFYQARRADRRFQDVRHLANVFVFDVHDRIRNLPGSTEARKVIVTTALQYLEKLRSDAAGDRGLLLELAQTYGRIADVQGLPSQSNLGDTKGAIRSYVSALEILTALDQAGEPGARLPLADVQFRLAMARISAGQKEQALKELSVAGETIRAAARQSPGDKDVLHAAVNILANAARTFFGNGDLERAIQTGEQAAEFAGQLEKIDSSPQTREQLASGYRSLATAHMAAGNLEAAAASLRQVVAIRETLARNAPQDSSLQRLLMIAYGTLGDFQGYRPENLGDLPGAVESFEKAGKIAEWLHQADPADRKARADVANVRLRLGSVYVDTPGRADAGVSLLREAFEIFTQLSAADPPNTTHRYNLASIEGRIGEGLAVMGRRQEAIERLESARRRAVPLFATTALSRATYTRATLSLAELTAAADPPKASRLAAEVASEMEVGKYTPWNRAVDSGRLAKVYLQLGRRDAAVPWLETAAKAWREAKPPAARQAHRAQELRAVEALLGR
ncbi:MAG: serine/threonine-protein kinase [Bryobacteraceae bacterium]